MGNIIEETYDIAVVGAGHAGCEAALAAARLGLKTIIFTVSVDSIALMPCNPNIGGTSKGHLVRELDALGGEMGRNIDKTFIQSRMLNTSKGPAVHSLRAQADKQAYTREMRRTLEKTEGLTIRQAEVSELILEEIPENVPESLPENISENIQVNIPEKNQEQILENTKNNITEKKTEKITSRRKMICRGVKTVSGAAYHTKAVVLATGVYLNACCIFGEVVEKTGPNGLKAATHLTDSMIAAGIQMTRFKTGTPARVDGRTVDFSKMEEQKGDVPVIPFSFETDPASVQKEQVSCWLTHTGETAHEIIRQNIDRSPLYNGSIHSTGPRYCPSIEDKVMKFPDKDGHQIFVEPEGLYTHELYLGGMSSSLPEDVQYQVIHATPGLEHAVVVRNAYAIEYDLIDARQLYPTLEFQRIKGLFSGGQSNGSSGYEEAAVQGFMAGVNAAMEILGREQIVLKRSEAYIGVLIDDLVTKESHEPYRMMTSRAEHRLLLRQDNADLRLSETGYRIGLISEERIKKVRDKKENIKKEIERLSSVRIGASAAVNDWLISRGCTPIKTGTSLAEMLRRNDFHYPLMKEMEKELNLSCENESPVLSPDTSEQVEIEIKYEGYIKRQEQQVRQFNKMEEKRLPSDLDYRTVKSLRLEAIQKLNLIHPRSIGQASRISGVSPADISVLLVWLAANKGQTENGN